MPIEFSDGATHTISSASGAIKLTRHTDLIVSAGAAIVATMEGRHPLRLPAIPGVEANSGAISVEAGSISGTAWSGTPGGDPTEWNWTGSPGVYVRGPGSLSVSGGAISGGANGGPGIAAVQAAVTITGGSVTSDRIGLQFTLGPSLVISGGTFTGGSYGAVVGLEFGSCSITGGQFQATEDEDWVRSLLVEHRNASCFTTISGGTFSDPIALRLRPGSGPVTFTGSGLSYSGGVLSGTLTSGDPISVEVVLEKGSLSSSSPSEIVFNG